MWVSEQPMKGGEADGDEAGGSVLDEGESVGDVADGKHELRGKQREREGCLVYIRS